MFGKKGGGVIDRLVAAGFPPEWARPLRHLLSNPLQAIEHRGPITIRLPPAGRSKTVANRAKAAPPTDAALSGPALTLHNDSGLAVHSRFGGWIVDGNKVDPVFSGSPGTPALAGGDQFNLKLPGVFDHYTWFNYPISVNDDIRMGQDLIFKYSTPSYGSSLRRFKLLENFGTSVAGAAWAIGLDWNLNQVGIPFLVYDNLPSGGQFSCATAGLGGYAMYFSDGAPSYTLPDGTVLTGAPADCAHRPNMGKWAVVSVDNTAAAPTQITYVARICCINNNLIICTQTATFKLCPGQVTVGAIDCGGSAGAGCT